MDIIINAIVAPGGSFCVALLGENWREGGTTVEAAGATSAEQSRRQTQMRESFLQAV